MNRVLIIGLLEGQRQMFRDEFPRLDIRFADKNVAGVNTETAKRADRIFLMTRFAAHAQQDRVPRYKLTLVRGGMDSLRDALQAYTATIPVKDEHVGYVAPREPEETDEEFMARINHEVGISDIRGKKPGESLLVERPHNMSKDEFKARMTRYRTYYKRVHACPTEAEFARDGNSVLITRLALEAPKVAEAEPVPTDGAVDMSDRLEGAEVEAVPKEGPRPPDAEFMRFGLPPQNVEAALWERVVLQSMQQSPGSPVTHHINNANAVADAFRRRFRS